MLSPNFLSTAERGPQPVASVKTNKEVTPEKFANFMEWLSPDPERAGEEYERLRSRFLSFFSGRRCNAADELADETINRVILKSSEETIDNKLAYCYGVARNVYRESLRKERTRVDIDGATLAAKAPEEPGFLQRVFRSVPEEASSRK